jgi:hypothetical protein
MRYESLLDAVFDNVGENSDYQQNVGEFEMSVSFLRIWLSRTCLRQMESAIFVCVP